MTPPPVYYRDDSVTLLLGDARDVLAALPDGSVDCIVTSPPYFGLRDYGTPGQYGLEATPADYVETMRAVFAEARRVLADDGTLWLNLGDSYYSGKGEPTQPDEKNAARRPGKRVLDGPSWGLPRKNLVGIPWRTAFALQDDGWILRNEIVWHKPNAMPESVRDRLSNRHERLFLFAKRPSYWFDLDAIREPQKTASERHEGRSCGSGEGWPTAWSAKTRTLNPKGGNPGDFWEIDEQPFEFPRGMLTQDEAAYIAAFIDGEGSICIRRRPTQIQLMLTVVNTHEGIIRWLHDRTGMGQIRKREMRNEKWRQVWEWSVTSRQAAQVIWAVYRYFRVKQQQAALALRFMELTRNGGSGSAPPEYHETRRAMAEDLAALNAGRITASRFAVAPVKPLPSSAGAVDVWSITTRPYPAAHFAVFPIDLPIRCITAGCRPGGVVCDPFSGSGTTGAAARQLGRRYVGIDLSEDYHRLAMKRFEQGVFAVGQTQAEPPPTYRQRLLTDRPENAGQSPEPSLFDLLAADDGGGDDA